jgi:amidase
MLLPVTGRDPYPHGAPEPHELAGRTLRHWAEASLPTYGITLSLCPAIAMPAGFAPGGAPVGLQLVGPPRGEAALLSLAAAVEDILAVSPRAPVDPQPIPEEA